MSKEIKLSAPLSMDWCNLTDPPCSLKPQVGHDCGIKERLRAYYGKEQIEEAEWLLEVSQNDPERFHQICINSLYPFQDSRKKEW